MSQPTEQALIEAASKAAQSAYCPYSNFHVGAALLDDQGRVWTGANVENAAYPAGNCAERNTLYHAITHGAAKGSFRKIVIHTHADRPTAPCGGCRQALHELAPGIEVVMVTANGQRKHATIEQLLPGAFDASDLATD